MYRKKRRDTVQVNYIGVFMPQFEILNNVIFF